MVIAKDMSHFRQNCLDVEMYTEIVFSKKDTRFIATNDGVDSSREGNGSTPIPQHHQREDNTRQIDIHYNCAGNFELSHKTVTRGMA